MSYLFSIEERQGFLHIHVTGENTPENVRRYLREVYEACARTRIRSVLIEENLAGPSLDPVDVYRITTAASPETSPIVLKIAYVDVQTQRPSSNIRLGEAVARDRGVNVRAFHTVKGAEEWLSKGDGPHED
ncbi:MAG: hypothetical protein ACT4QE_20885 [Anaerolineales bacterium]